MTHEAIEDERNIFVALDEYLQFEYEKETARVAFGERRSAGESHHCQWIIMHINVGLAHLTKCIRHYDFFPKKRFRPAFL